MRAFLKGFGAAACGLALAGCHHDSPNGSNPAGSSAAVAPSASASAEPESHVAIPKEAIDAALNPAHLPEYSGPTGSIEGTISVIGPPSPDVKVEGNVNKCPAAIDTWGKLFREGGGPAEANGPRPLADAVVAVTGYAGFFVPETRPAFSITIAADCSYPQRTLAVTYGQRIEVTNLSRAPFAPIMDAEASPAVMMAAPLGAGDPIRIYPRIPGHSVMGDLMQPYAREDVYVLRFPFHDVSTRDGHYRIDGLPVGKLTVGAQHPTVASQASAPVEIKANVVQRVDLTLEYKPDAASKPQSQKDQKIFR
jgi:hypothetical protein